MQHGLEALESLRLALAGALESRDWEAIGVLDSQCRALMGNNSGIIDSDLRGQIEALSRLYIELQQAARAERERIASDLTRLNQSKQVNQAYKAFG